MIATCIEKSNCELREQLCSTIKLTGGNLSIKGLNEIMHTIIKNLLPKYHNKIKIKPNPNSTISCWIGGNIVANLGIFKDLLITKKNWEENGNDIIHKQTI